MNAAQDSLKELLSAMEAFITTKTVVGEPIHMGDTILLPLVDVQFGAGAGAREKGKGPETPDRKGTAGGVGAKMSPSAVLVIKDGQIRLVNIKQQDTVTKVLDMVPDLVDKFKGTFKKEDEEIIDVVKNAEKENENPAT